MEWGALAALVIAVPVILFPAAYVWYINIGGIIAAIRDALAVRAARKAPVKAPAR